MRMQHEGARSNIAVRRHHGANGRPRRASSEHATKRHLECCHNAKTTHRGGRPLRSRRLHGSPVPISTTGREPYAVYVDSEFVGAVGRDS